MQLKIVVLSGGGKKWCFDRLESDMMIFCEWLMEGVKRIHHINVPSGMTVEKARLYVYWYDWSTEPGQLANLSVNFSGTTFTTPDAAYIDQKGFAWYNYPKGTYAYNVTSLVTTGSNDYSVIVKNIDPTHSTNLLGELLLVVYEDPSKNPNNYTQLWLMEGCDLLMGDDEFCVTPEEATATVTFPGTINVANVTSAKLITVVAQGMEYGSNMLFNGNVIKTNAWNESSEAGPKTTTWVYGSRINVEVMNVTSNIVSSDNTVGFQDTGTKGMQASNAILIVHKRVPGPTPTPTPTPTLTPTPTPAPKPVPAITPLGFIVALVSLFGLAAVAMREMHKR